MHGMDQATLLDVPTENLPYFRFAELRILRHREFVSWCSYNGNGHTIHTCTLHGLKYM